MVKVAFVGCGGIQHVHCTYLSRNPEVTIVGHCDVERARAEESARRFGGEPFADFAAMFDKTKPQAAFIAVRPLRALRHGRGARNVASTCSSRSPLR